MTTKLATSIPEFDRRIAALQRAIQAKKQKGLTDTTDECLLACGIRADIEDNALLPPEAAKELMGKLNAAAYETSADLPGVYEPDRYGNDAIVAAYVASGMSMRKIARKFGINVSTVSKHIKKWGENCGGHCRRPERSKLLDWKR